MDKEIGIPEGYEARIEGNKVILQRKESEDEKIRKELIQYLKDYPNLPNGQYSRDDFFAYLERQKEPHYTKRNTLFDKCVENCDPAIMKEVSDSIDKILEKEQKPAEWSEEEEKDIQEASNYLRDYANNYVQGENSKLYVQNLADRIESLPPRPREGWSEEDDMLIDELESYILYDKEFNDEQKSWRIKRLKSLCPKPHWKPSEEQMEALKDAKMRMSLDGYGLCPLLQTLINDLEKL